MTRDDEERTADTSAVWEQRFRAPSVSLPLWARDAPARCLYSSDATGVRELYAWDRGSGTHRQVTDRTKGTTYGVLEPDGEAVWWFDDTDGDEFGVWRRQDFAGPAPTSSRQPDPVAVQDAPRAYSAGLALGRGGLAVVGCSDEGGTRVLVTPTRGGTTREVYAHQQDAHLGGLSRDGSLLALAHSEHGDSRHKALRVLRVSDGHTVADLWDGPGKGLQPLGFAPVEGDGRMLVGHERRDRPELLVWDVATGAQTELALDLPGELSAQWWPDGRALLVSHEHEARSELHRYDLSTGELRALGTPAGVVSAATVRPDGVVELAWSSAASPPSVRTLEGTVVLAPPGRPAPPSVPVEDAWVDGPGGRIHALVSRPATGAEPYPTVFIVHGGPTWHDDDAFAPDVAAHVDEGRVVVRVNYRGSTGYGVPWRDALEGRVGRTELEDIGAVRDWAVTGGLADPERMVLTGASWGGYLTLLGLGTQPERWSLGVAAVPVADYVAAYEDEMDALKAFDRALFGGSPEQVPDAYHEASPLTYVGAVRVPVLVLGGANDPRCPIRQIDTYLAALATRGAPHEVYRFDAGHGSQVVEERVRQMRVELDFVARYLPGAT